MNKLFPDYLRSVKHSFALCISSCRWWYVPSMLLAVVIVSCTDDNQQPRKQAKKKTDTGQASKRLASKAFDIHVLIENSLSMHGYVKGVTSFEVALMRLLRQLHQATYRSSMSLSYINSDVYPVFDNAAERDIDAYITNVEPATFGSQGDRTNTNLRHVINTALKSVTSNSVALLVSDMILSPGRTVSSADFLEQEKAAIQYDLQAFMKRQPSLTLLAMQLFSEFNGQYYIEYSEQRGERIVKSKPLNGRMKRPYYVWILGPRDLVSEIAGTLRVDELRANGLRNVGMIAAPGTVKELGVTVKSRQSNGRLARTMRGQYAINRNAVKKVDRVVPDPATGSLDWLVELDLPMDMRLMSDTVEIRSIRNAHTVKLQSAAMVSPKKLRLSATSTWERAYFTEDVVRLRLMQRPPNWFFASGNQDDRRTLYDPATMFTTFGLSSLMTGVWAALGGSDPRLGWAEVSLAE